MVVKQRAVLFLFALALVWAEGNASSALAQGKTVPVERRGHYFLVMATRENKPLRLILDSGAGAHVLDLGKARELGMVAPNAGTGNLIGTGGTVEAEQIQTGEMRLGEVRLNQGLAFATQLPEALEADGLLGYDLFQQYVVTLDYPKNTVTFASPKEYKAPAGAEVLPLRVRRRIPQIEIELDGVKAWVEVDTGSNGSVDFNTPFVEKNNLRSQYTKRLEIPSGRGIGGITYGDITRARSLKLGSFVVDTPLLELSRQTTGGDSEDNVAGRIGAEVLSRFTVTLDYSGNRMYLQKGPNFAKPFPYNRTGVSVDRDKNAYTVVHVIEGSPGAEAGIRAGDELIALDGVPVNKISSYDLRDRFRAAPGTVLRLLVRSKDNPTPREVTLTLKDLI
ncbi:MAG: hypothetical protein OHK0029_41830 [Armatimonadaceae bacterium]